MQQPILIIMLYIENIMTNIVETIKYVFIFLFELL